MSEQFNQYLEERVKEVEESLESFMNRRFDAPEKIVISIKYSLFGPGKKLRPILVLETAKALGEDPNEVRALADALEMIHTYSLIHDDLPAMDDDDLRRGKATNHIVFGEDIAILAGDALLNMAMERALEGIPKENPENYIKALKMIFHQSGINGMVGGQVADVTTEIHRASTGIIDYINTHKTGALISAAVLSGAVPFIGTEDPRVESLYNYSNALGKAFQITDDILDVEGDAEKMGKSLGSDERNKRVTFVSLYGVASARETVEDLRRQAHESLNEVDGDTWFLEELIDYVCSRSK